MWVQLRSMQHISKNGKQTTCHPGDWVDVGKQQAMLWVSRGEAVIPGAGTGGRIAIPGSGVVVPEGHGETTRKALEALNLDVTEGDGLAYERTLLWDGQVNLQLDLIMAGFAFLGRWQVACPLDNYEVLACHAGNEEDRAKTKAVIRDLRVPLYRTDVMFVRRDKDTQRMLDLWRKETGDPKLAFLRALYVIKPLILALPTTWWSKSAPR